VHRRPSSFNIVKNACSALSFDEAPNSASLSVMSAHLRPTLAFPTARIGDLPQERDHPKLLHQWRVKGNLVEAVEDLGRRARRLATFAGVDLDQDHIRSLALAHERCDSRVSDVAAVPIGLAIDLDRLEHRRQQADASSTSGVISLLRNTRPRPVCTLVAVMKSLIDASPRCAKSMLWRRISLMGLKPNGLRLYGEMTRDIKSITR
jgi:hypothetical protein